MQGDSEVHVIKDMDHSLKSFEGDFKALEFKKNYEEGRKATSSDAGRNNYELDKYEFYLA